MTKTSLDQYVDILQEDALFTVKQVSEMVSVSEKTIYRNIKDGRLRAVMFGRRTIRIQTTSLVEWLRNSGFTV